MLRMARVAMSLYKKSVIIEVFLPEHSFYNEFFISMVLLRIPTPVQPMTGIEGFKYQASDG